MHPRMNVPDTHHRIVVTAQEPDIDNLNHVSNLVYLRWVLEAALSHSDSRGWDHAAYQELGAIWVVRRHEIDYMQSARLGDALSVTTWVPSFKRASCVRRTEILRESDGAQVLRAATTWAFVTMETGRPTRIPEVMHTTFGA